MISYVLLRDDLSVLQCGTCADESEIPSIPGVSAEVISSSPPKEIKVGYTLYYRNGAFSFDTTLDRLKSLKWGEVKNCRSAAEYGGFTWDDSTFDSDALSQQKIIGASQMATLTPGFEIDWTLADNTVRTLNAAEMNAVGVALGQHVNAQYVKARALRQQIEDAATREEVAAIAW